jgi:hypothetical protein
MSEKKYKGIKLESLINIKISGAFYADLKTVLFEYVHEGETQESVTLMLKNIQNKTVTTSKEKYCYLIMALLAQVEADAADQGLIDDFVKPSEEDLQN